MYWSINVFFFREESSSPGGDQQLCTLLCNCNSLLFTIVTCLQKIKCCTGTLRIFRTAKSHEKGDYVTPQGPREVYVYLHLVFGMEYPSSPFCGLCWSTLSWRKKLGWWSQHLYFLLLHFWMSSSYFLLHNILWHYLSWKPVWPQWFPGNQLSTKSHWVSG